MPNASSASPKHTSNVIQFDRESVLGEGNSVVYNGTYQGRIVAVKRIELNRSSDGDEDNCEAQMKLDHENLVKILAVRWDLDFRCIALEPCYGTLFEVIQNTYNGPALPPDRKVMYQIADGLAYIHSNKLAHRDIKPENILISKEGQIKLSEFGLKRPTKDKCYITGPKGALLWMAPEQFQTIHKEIDIAQKSDVFSCGCVFFVILMRKNDGMHPFGDNNDHLQIYANIQEGNSINLQKANDTHPLEAKLIQKMIRRDPVERITSEDVKNRIGEWLSNCNSTIKPPTPQTGLCNQIGEAAFSREKLTVDCGKPGAKSREKRYFNHDFEAARCDVESVNASCPGNRGILPNGQESEKKRSTLAPPAKQHRYNLRDLSSAGISNDRRNPDYHTWLNSASNTTHTIAEVTVSVMERGESEWKLNDFDSQQCSCDSNNNHGVP